VDRRGSSRQGDFTILKYRSCSNTILSIANTFMAGMRATVGHLRDYSIVELRRYAIKSGERNNFAEYFQSYFPEAFQQLSVIVFGTFFERRKPERFTWIRGFHDHFHRGSANSAFYYGPVWREHRARMNDRIEDSDNVIQLTPVDPSRPIPVLPAVDPVTDKPQTRGTVVAVIFPVKADEVTRPLESFGPLFAEYRAAGFVEVSVLQTIDAPNTFPQLPIRSDGPFVVWLGIAPSSTESESRAPFVFETGSTEDPILAKLRGQPEVIVLDPTPRSRLRWLPEFFGPMA